MTAAHPLDRPVWNALTTRQAYLAEGDARALRFDPSCGPFAAPADASPESLAALGDLLLADRPMWVVEAEAVPTPPSATLVRAPLLHQMVAERIAPSGKAFDMVALTEANAGEMRALAILTEPGPFLEHTHRLGEFIGIKQEGRLVAMAGERMKPEGFTEVSGVCTHPDFRGRGYAGALMRAVGQAILARGETPFLHVYGSNAGAIALYEALGFRFRREMAMMVLVRA